MEETKNTKEKLLKECMNYFKKNKAYDRLFKKFKRKYMSLGTFSGNVVIENPNYDERHILSGFMKKNYYKSKNININLEKFKENFKNTKFGDIDIEFVLNEYFSEIILSNKELNKNSEDSRSDFFKCILVNYENTIAFMFFNMLLQTKTTTYKLLMDNYSKDKESLKKSIIFVCDALNNLPKTKTLISVFSSKIAKNPHKFDYGTLEYKLIISALRYLSEDKSLNVLKLEEKVALLYTYNLLIDDMSNYVLTAGLLGYINFEKHDGIKGYFGRYEHLMLNLQNLSNLDSLESVNRKVFVFENPSVFSNIYDYFKSRNLKVSLICTYGQIKLSGYVILDMLTKTNSTIYYSGDIDPEGIQIADKLKTRYENQFKFMMYDENIYLSKMFLQHTNQDINIKRLSQLNKIKSTELIDITKTIIQYKKCVYQEQYIEEIIRYIEGEL